ncbi:MAG: YybH family protein [Terriglobia bacterium]
MKKLWPVFAALLLLGAGCAPAVDLEAERAALLAADRAWSQSAPDVDRFLSFYADDASLLPPGAPIATGKDAIRAYLAEFFAAPGLTLSWTTTRAEVARAGDLAYTSGTYQVTFLDAEGNTVTSAGKTQVVWKKQADGQWKVIADQFNRDTPAPASTN